MSELTGIGRRFAHAWQPMLAGLWGKTALEVRALGAEILDGAALSRRLEGVSATSLHGPESRVDEVLLSLDGRGLLEQLDLAFGGNGEIGDDLPKCLPRSAALFAQRIERAAAAALSACLGGLELQPGFRGDCHARIAPFADDEEIATLAFELAGTPGSPWRITLAARTAWLAPLLARGGAARSPHKDKQPPACPETAPFAEIPLHMTGTLVDMEIPLARLAVLSPGAVLPIAVARNVPLRIGDTVIARGTVGELDDRVALQITQSHVARKEPQ